MDFKELLRRVKEHAYNDNSLAAVKLVKSTAYLESIKYNVLSALVYQAFRLRYGEEYNNIVKEILDFPEY